MIHKGEKFGTLLGIAPGNVPAYSCDYSSVDPKMLPKRKDFRHYVDGIFMGYKWQCVEFARRWLYCNKGYIFDDISMAYDIFNLTHVQSVQDGSRLPLHSFKNGSLRHPEVGCLLIWEAGGEFEVTGHVAVITEVSTEGVRIAEQNLYNKKWTEDNSFSRELHAKIDDDGGYWIACQTPGAKILGWVIQTDNAEYAEEINVPEKYLFNLQYREVPNKGQAKKKWLNIANPDEAAYVAASKGKHRLVTDLKAAYRYFCLSETAYDELVRATNELHYMFMHATEFVLKDDNLLEKFCIPKSLWSRLHRSWDNRRNEMISGRMDFSISERGLKIYEYNADSAACYMECGKVQAMWAEYFECKEGDCAGENLFQRLVNTWKESGVDGILHIMRDHDAEESYHALFMKMAIEKAGIETKVIVGTDGLEWDENGNAIDKDGQIVRWVWKTWAWETALDQIREECDLDDKMPPLCLTKGIKFRHSDKPRLVDVLLTDDVMVFEPFWTLIPSNKAILPILWSLYPNHPYLLNTQFKLTPELCQSGYVVKPIVGRCGENISIFNHEQSLLSQTFGKFEDRDQIYQELFPLPKFDGYNVQMSTFSVQGTFAGACVRMDPTIIVSANSDIPALRVLSDEDMV